jgi:hypothetical protein
MQITAILRRFLGFPVGGQKRKLFDFRLLGFDFTVSQAEI